MFWSGFAVKPELEGMRRSGRVAGLQAQSFYSRSRGSRSDDAPSAIETATRPRS
jgi:hypothetical protein